MRNAYSLRSGEIGYEEMLQELKIIFERYQRNGLIEFVYNTKMYYGNLKK